MRSRNEHKKVCVSSPAVPATPAAKTPSTATPTSTASTTTAKPATATPLLSSGSTNKAGVVLPNEDLQHVWTPMDPTDPVSIVRVLTLWRSSVIKVDEACEALCTLSVDPKANRAVLAEDGLDALLDVARKYPANDKLSEKVAFVLRNWSVEAGLKQPVIRSGGVDVLLKMMVLHAKHPDVVSTAATALAHLAVYPTLTELAEMPACSSQLFAALRTHMTDESVVEPVCRAITNLSLSRVTQLALAVNGLAARDLYKAVQTHEMNKSICTVVCWCLGQLAQVSANHCHLRARGGLETLQAAQRRHPAHVALAYHFCVVLSNVLGSVNGSADTAPPPTATTPDPWVVLARSSIDPLIQSLKHATDDEGQLAARLTTVFFYLAVDHPDSIERLRSHGAKPLLSAAFARASPENARMPFMRDAVAMLDKLLPNI